MTIQGRHAGKIVGDNQYPMIVGVLNISPESFYKGSVLDQQMEKVSILLKEGADCLDVGAMSTRPIALYGGKQISVEEEKERIKTVLPRIIDIASSYNVPIAIDTQHAQVAELAIKLGCNVVNDISGLKTDPRMTEIVAETDVDLVIMATRNKPGDVCGIDKTILALEESMKIATGAGIDPEKIVIDPGFGGWQGKSKECDLELLKNFEKLRQLNRPIYIGISRKSTISTLKGGETPDDRLFGSIILTQWLVDRGAHIIRTHDVKATRLGLNVYFSLKSL